MRALNVRQIRFINGIVAGKTQARAYLDAGYSCTQHSAEVNGNKLLKNARILAEIEETKRKSLTAAGVTAELVTREFARIAFGNVANYFDADGNPRNVAELTEDVAAALASIEVEAKTVGRGKKKKVVSTAVRVKLWDKLEALKALADMLKMTGAQNPTPPAMSQVVVVSVGGEARISDL